ncbi:hypothetical protein BTVI_01128 [Pitangus sulphuratus]|nr:hypothetical protein BTVI_01128 [Pitangus sulphuratus]
MVGNGKECGYAYKIVSEGHCMQDGGKGSSTKHQGWEDFHGQDGNEGSDAGGQAQEVMCPPTYTPLLPSSGTVVINTALEIPKPQNGTLATPVLPNTMATRTHDTTFTMPTSGDVINIQNDSAHNTSIVDNTNIRQDGVALQTFTGTLKPSNRVNKWPTESNLATNAHCSSSLQLRAIAPHPADVSDLSTEKDGNGPKASLVETVTAHVIVVVRLVDEGRGATQLHNKPLNRLTFKSLGQFKYSDTFILTLWFLQLPF